MKKYVVGLLLLLVMQNVQAMKLAKLSSEDDAKALRFAKLFNKYPKGYGETDQDKQAIVCKMSCFSQDVQHAPLYSCVKKYQDILNNDVKLSSDIQSHIFTQALHDDAKQYYAISNALKFVVISSRLVWNGFYSTIMDYYRPCFIDELCENDGLTISFSEQGDNDTLYPLDDSLVLSQCYTHPKHSNNSRLNHQLKRKIIRELVAFIHKDAQKVRIEAFETIFASWVECLANEADKEKNISMFIELLGLLKKWQNISLVDKQDCKKVLATEDELKNISSNFMNSACIR